jgi:hypothetical protein
VLRCARLIGIRSQDPYFYLHEVKTWIRVKVNLTKLFINVLNHYRLFVRENIQEFLYSNKHLSILHS